MCFIVLGTECIVDLGPPPRFPAGQIVSSQQVDRHLLPTLRTDIITPQFCDSCWFVGGAMSHFHRIGYRLPERVL